MIINKSKIASGERVSALALGLLLLAKKRGVLTCASKLDQR